MVAWCYVVANGSPPLNSAGVPIAGDYIAFHTAGRLLLTGHGPELYDHSAVTAVQSTLLGGRIPGFYDAFRNPPFAALPFVPLALLDLTVGFGVWTTASIACLLVSVRLLLDELPWLKRRQSGFLVLVLAFAPVYFGLIDGENASVSLLLYVLIFRALGRRRDGLAGMWAALGLFKPQLFLVFPLVFLAGRRWRALMTYALSAVALGAASAGLVGQDGLTAWLRILVEPESSNALANAWRMVSLKSFVDLLLPGQPSLDLGLYVAGCLLVVCGLVAIWARRNTSPQLAWIFTSLAAALVDPHLVDYDLSVLVPAGVFSAMMLPALRWPIVALYVSLPLRAQIPIGSSNVQVPIIVLVGCAAYAWAMCHRPPVDLTSPSPA